MDKVEECGESVDLSELAGKRGGQIEAEAVDVHLSHPVAQGVHDELEDLRGTHEQGVARSRRVEVVAAIPIHEAVIRRVVDAAE